MSSAPEAGLRGFARDVAATSASNVAMAVAAGLAGVLIARALGPEARGQYAAIIVWFGVALVVGELGQTAATTYFVANDPRRAADYLATSRRLMVLSGSVALGAGALLAPLLARGDSTVAWGHRLMFAACLASFVGAAYTFSLQATHPGYWNLARVFQPVAYTLVVGAAYAAGQLSLLLTLGLLAGTIAAQTLLARRLCARRQLTGGSPDPVLRRLMTRYGLGHLASRAPTVLVTRLDYLVLSLAVAPAALGHYAVAASVTGIAAPAVAALGSMGFPRLASRTLPHASAVRLQRWAVLSSAGVAVALLTPAVCLAPWLVPLVFGTDYRAAAGLVALLAPAGAFRACGQVCGDLLRGHGRPYTVARAQLIAAGATVVLLSALVPPLGVAGAAIASSTAAGLALLLMLAPLRRLTSTAPALASAGDLAR